MDDTLSNLYFLGLDPVNSVRTKTRIFCSDQGRRPALAGLTTVIH